MQSAEGDYAMYWAWASAEVGPDGTSTNGDSGGSHRGQAIGAASHGDSTVSVSAGGTSVTVGLSDAGPPFSTPTPASISPDASASDDLVGVEGETTGAVGLAAGSPGGEVYGPASQGGGTQASAGAFAMPGSGSTGFANVS